MAPIREEGVISFKQVKNMILAVQTLSVSDCLLHQVATSVLTTVLMVAVSFSLFLIKNIILCKIIQEGEIAYITYKRAKPHVLL